MPVVVLLLGFGVLWYLTLREQHRRIALLASVLAQFQVEKMMETVADGYLRALGEEDAGRREQIWNMLGQAELTLCAQVQAFAEAFDRIEAAEARFSTLPIPLPYAERLFPSSSADLRALLHVHARGVEALVRNAEGLGQKDRAYMLTAELLLLQHSCQWYCRSRAAASARMLARHQTPHAQIVASVSQRTRTEYQALLG